MERSIGLAFTTLMIFAPLAHAAHPKQAVKPEGTASPFTYDGDRWFQTADPDPAGSGMLGGCMAAGGLPSGATALALLGVLRRRRRR